MKLQDLFTNFKLSYENLCCSQYTSFIRPNPNYGDIIYDQAYNTSLHQSLELLQYNACLAIAGAIRGISNQGQNYMKN